MTWPAKHPERSHTNHRWYHQHEMKPARETRGCEFLFRATALQVPRSSSRIRDSNPCPKPSSAIRFRSRWDYRLDTYRGCIPQRHRGSEPVPNPDVAEGYNLY